MADPARKLNEPEPERAATRPELEGLDGESQTSAPTGKLRLVKPAENDYSQNDEQPVTRPSTQDLGGGGQSSEPRTGHLKSGDTREQLSDAETGANEPERVTGANAESKQLGQHENQVGSGYSPAKKTSRIRFSRRKKYAAGGGVIGLIATILAFSILQGPFQVIHFAQLLQRFHFTSDQNLMDNRTGRLIQYARTYNNPEKRNLSSFGNKFANHYEAKLKAAGITPEYDGGRIKSLLIDPRTPQGKAAINTLREKGIVLSSSDFTPEGKYRIDIDKPGVGSAHFRRQVIAGMIDTIGMGKISSSVASRVLKVRAGVDFHPLKNISKAADENLRVYYKKVQAERANRTKNGIIADPRTTTAGSTQDANGNKVTAPADTAAAAEANGLLADAGASGTTVEQRASSIRGKLTAGAGVTGFLALVCGVKALGDSSADLRQANIVLPLTRVGMNIITTGSQVMAGQGLNLDELGAVSENFHDKTTNTSWVQAKSIQAELGQKTTGPDMPDGTKPGADSKPAFFGVVDSFVNAVPGGSVFCKGVNSTIGGWVLSGLSIVVAATGPIGFAINGSVEAAQYVLTGTFIDDLVRWIAGEQVDANAAGALLGNYANYGARLAANDASISHGGTALSASQEVALKNENNQLLNTEEQNKPLYARLLDPQDPDSFLGRLILNSPRLDGSSMVASATRFPGTLFTGFASSFRGLLSPKTQAASAPYDYGFPAFGFTLDEVDDNDYQDPYANAVFVEPRLADLNSKYGEPCFNTTVDPATFALTTTQAKRYDEINKAKVKCDDRSNVELTRYRFYLADRAAANSMACYEGMDEESCAELGFGGSTTGTTTPAPGTAAGAQIVGDVFESSVNIACAPGTTDLDIQDGYSEGTPIKFRACALSNLTSTSQESTPGDPFYVAGSNGKAIVNSRVSGAWLALIDAAKNAGFNTRAGSSFRTMAHQQALCAANSDCSNGRYGSVAKPGNSPHQLGLAIDFGDIYDSVGGNAGPCNPRQTSPLGFWKWLVDNAWKNFGFKQYCAEAWHWDATNYSNRVP